MLFGARQFDMGEAELLDECGVNRIATLAELNKWLPSLIASVEQIYLHIDLDVLDPAEAIANQWTPPNGITIQTLLSAVADIREQMKPAALGIASYDPAVDGDVRALSAALDVIKVLLEKNE